MSFGFLLVTDEAYCVSVRSSARRVVLLLSFSS